MMSDMEFTILLIVLCVIITAIIVLVNIRIVYLREDTIRRQREHELFYLDLDDDILEIIHDSED